MCKLASMLPISVHTPLPPSPKTITNSLVTRRKNPKQNAIKTLLICSLICAGQLSLCGFSKYIMSPFLQSALVHCVCLHFTDLKIKSSNVTSFIFSLISQAPLTQHIFKKFVYLRSSVVHRWMSSFILIFAHLHSNSVCVFFSSLCLFLAFPPLRMVFAHCLLL